MSHEMKAELIDVYKQYGFELAKYYRDEDVLVFTLKTGYFDNADIVPLSESAQTSKAFDDFQKTGYACTIRQIKTSEQAEQELFNGFFSVNSILNRLQNDYTRFTHSIISQYSSSATYEYINAPYLINERLGESSPTEEIVKRLDSPRPALFVIEAAAGFGKTCTAFELVNTLVKRQVQLPLFAELSRNRQAVIFRHVLLDEIDHKFPTLSSRLVQSEIKNGRVVTILDGFDELLRKNEEGQEFQNKEPMLETISELLTGQAKIVLTTRRTVLFEGDAFHEWASNHSDQIDIVRIKISEPKVTDWLNDERFSALESTGLDIKRIANPVLLSYLRSISIESYRLAIANKHAVVDRYFEFMLRREMERQDLKIPPEKQQIVLSRIAEDMVNFGYTSETREYIVDQIERSNLDIIDEAIAQYPSNQKPTRDVISNKLASHALLDRSSHESNKISFVNEFVFGNYIGQVVLNSADFLSDDVRFLEPTAVSYQVRDETTRLKLWKKLKPSIEFLTSTDQFDLTSRVYGHLDQPLENGEVNNLVIDLIWLGQSTLSNLIFNDCIFKNCRFSTKNFSDITFLNCKFFNCKLDDDLADGPVHVFGGECSSNFIEELIAKNMKPDYVDEVGREHLAQQYVLERFWPVGRQTISHKHRPIKGIVSSNSQLRPEELYAAITSLKKIGVLIEPDQPAFVEINFNEINQIRTILGRDNYGQ